MSEIIETVFTVIKVAEKGEGRLVRVSEDTGTELAGRRAWAWVKNPKQKNDTFKLPVGKYHYVPVEIPNPEDEESTVTITMLEAL